MVMRVAFTTVMHGGNAFYCCDGCRLLQRTLTPSVPAVPNGYFSILVKPTIFNFLTFGRSGAQD